MPTLRTSTQLFVGAAAVGWTSSIKTPQQSTDSDCQFVPFDFKTLRDLDFFDDDAPAVAEVVDESSSMLAICDTEMSQPVDPADDALALQL